MPKDHFVPRFYLKHFELDGAFWVHDKTLGKSWQSNHAQTAKIEDFYTFAEESGKLNSDIEKQLSELEGRHAEVVRRVVQSEGLPGDKETRADLLHLVAFQYLRTPAQANITRTALEAGAEAMLESISNDPKIISDYLKEHPDETPESFRVGVMSGRFVLNRGVHVVKTVEQAETIHRILAKKQGMAVIKCSENMEYWTSDTPVNVWWQTAPDRVKLGGIAQPSAEIWYPLTRKLGLYIGPPTPFEAGVPREFFCKTMNERILWDADRIVVSSTRSPELTQRAKQCQFPGPRVNRGILLTEARTKFQTEGLR